MFQGFHFPSFSRPPNTSLSLSLSFSLSLSLSLSLSRCYLHVDALETCNSSTRLTMTRPSPTRLLQLCFNWGWLNWCRWRLGRFKDRSASDDASAKLRWPWWWRWWLWWFSWISVSIRAELGARERRVPKWLEYLVIDATNRSKGSLAIVE